MTASRLFNICLAPLVIWLFCAAAPSTDELVLIPGGAFRMGDIFSEGAEHERPVHDVQIDSFFLSKTEVTVAQFRAFIQATGYRTLEENQRVEFDVQQGQKGPQAANVRPV